MKKYNIFIKLFTLIETKLKFLHHLLLKQPHFLKYEILIGNLEENIYYKNIQEKKNYKKLLKHNSTTKSFNQKKIV